MDIFLVRHGEAAASWGESPDPGLSERGHRQARDAALHLKRHTQKNTLLITSPLQRAMETAEPLSQTLQQPVVVDDAFREIPSPVPLAQRQAWLRQFMQEHWAEQEEHLMAWRQAALDRLLALRRPAVVFTHFLLINAVVGEILDSPQTLCFWPDNGSITQLRHTGTRLELVMRGREMTTHVN